MDVDMEVGDSKRVLYFSRAAIPANAQRYYHHIGIYAFRRAALERMVNSPPSPLEKLERLEQLRALEAGMNIHAVVVSDTPISIDAPDDLEKARILLAPST
jgi:3-deoxy-manno-octulosonate cytidylyltransferase (CMP-KDO synthetase)